MARAASTRFIAGPAGRLEALVQQGAPDRPAVVICHPHPLYGGTMRNRVVYWMARAFEDLGMATVRFNFRGVEQSEGAWSDGEGEADDVRAVLDWVEANLAYRALWLAGFSFGCYAGLRAGRNDARIARFVAVAPAVNHWDFSFFQGDLRPIFVVVGDADEIVPADAVAQWAASLRLGSLLRVPRAGHFFGDQLPVLVDALRCWARLALD